GEEGGDLERRHAPLHDAVERRLGLIGREVLAGGDPLEEGREGERGGLVGVGRHVKRLRYDVAIARGKVGGGVPRCQFGPPPRLAARCGGYVVHGTVDRDGGGGWTRRKMRQRGTGRERRSSARRPGGRRGGCARCPTHGWWCSWRWSPLWCGGRRAARARAPRCWASRRRWLRGSSCWWRSTRVNAGVSGRWRRGRS